MCPFRNMDKLVKISQWSTLKLKHLNEVTNEKSFLIKHKLEEKDNGVIQVQGLVQLILLNDLLILKKSIKLKLEKL